MAFEDTHAFLSASEFGVTCQIGVGDTFVGILDSPMEVIAGGMALSKEYMLLAKTEDVSTLTRGSAIKVESVNYTVRENRPIDDGLFTELLLSKD